MIALDKIKIIISSLKAQLLLGFLLLFAGCENLKDEYSFSGATMGTTYIVKIVSSDIEIDLNAIERGVDSLLVQLNKQMSTWDPESEVSKFNKWYSKKPFSVSNDFLNVVSKAIIITDKTDGYFDPTVYDLMSLWGFGPNPKSGFPDIEDIHRALKSSGKGSIKIYDGNLIKNHEGSKLDLNAIAKGYGVDKIYKYLKIF